MEIKIIVAMDRHGGIGFKNRLPWETYNDQTDRWENPLKEDMRHFVNLTRGHTLLMGRKTWESLPKKMRQDSGRRYIVLTRNTDYVAENATTVYDFDPGVKPSILQSGNEEVFVIGGRQIYEMFEPVASVMYITKVDGEFEVDTYFPHYDRVGWKERLPRLQDFVSSNDGKTPYNLRFIELTRSHPKA